MTASRTDGSWLLDVLWSDPEIVPWWSRSHPDRRIDRLVAAPQLGSAKQLIPWRWTSIAASMRRVSDDRPRTAQWRDGAAVAGLMTVGAASRRRRVAVSAGDSLLVQVAEALGERSVRGSVMCGPPRANQKPVVQVHDHLGRTLAFVKVAWNDLTRDLLGRERTALEHLASVDHPDFRVPEVLATGSFGDATWLAIGALRVDRRERPSLSTADALAIAIERTAAHTTGSTADSPFTATLLAESEALPISGPLVSRLAERHGHESITTAGGHGDYVPWNILSGRPAPAVWDWERYGVASPVGSDRIHYRAQLAVQRRGMTVVDAFRSLSDEIDSVLPELADAQRHRHLDWYVAALLARYEHDATYQPTDRLRSRIADLTTVLEQREARP